MRTQNLLRKGIRLVEGLTFESGVQLFDKPNDIYAALVTTNFERELTEEQVCNNILMTASTLFKICIQNEDSYRRFQDNGAFFYLIMAEWNPMCLLDSVQIQQVVELLVGARRRYLSQAQGSEQQAAGPSTELVAVVDNYIAMADNIDRTRSIRRATSLGAPRGSDVSDLLAGASIQRNMWPTAQYLGLNIAVLAEQSVRKKVFGMSLEHREQVEEETYPNDTDLPSVVRAYLSVASLTRKAPVATVSLFLAPVAFTDHQHRQEWYLPTGHQSRYYGTIMEFISFAKAEFHQDGKDNKNHVMGLITGWHFDKDNMTKEAEKRNEAVPLVWRKSCYRAGLTICLTRLRRVGTSWYYRLTLFRPRKPTYALAAEPMARREKQDKWIDELLDRVDEEFEIEEGWEGGSAVNHEPPPPRGVSPDSVEVCCEIITEMMDDHKTIPATSQEFMARDFKVLDRYWAFRRDD